MAGEFAPTHATPGSVDPTQQAGIVDPTKAGIVDPKLREIDPSIRALVTDPASFSSETERDAARMLAQVESEKDALFNKVILRDQSGNPIWGNEYPNVFAFNHGIRGAFEKVPKLDPSNPDARLPGYMALTPKKEGMHTHVLIETDDGHNVLVRRTGDRKRESAAYQTFDMAILGGSKQQRQPISTKMLDGAVVIPGEPLKFTDPETGKTITSKGAVTRVTAFSPDQRVAPNHPYLKQQEYFRDTLREAAPLPPAAVQSLGASAVNHA